MPEAVVLTGDGWPDVLVWRYIALPEPGPGQVRIRVKAAGVSPIDTKIRHGDVQAAFPLPPEAILGFEAAGVVTRLVRPSLAYMWGTTLRSCWPAWAATRSRSSRPRGRRSRQTSPGAMPAALPAAAEAALGILKQLRVMRGETLLVLGAAGSVGMIAYGDGLADRVRKVGAH